MDSPLAINATEVFRLHPEYYDAETHAFMLEHRDPFGFSELDYLRRVEESKALNDRRDPMVIISASGMCEAGRILHHLKNNIESSRNTVLFVGFQAEHTLGRRILNGEETVPILGRRIGRRHVESIDRTAPADRDELLGTCTSSSAGIKRRPVHARKSARHSRGYRNRDAGDASPSWTKGKLSRRRPAGSRTPPRSGPLAPIAFSSVEAVSSAGSAPNA